jgi:succinoglycan biosynthesis protein ExoM
VGVAAARNRGVHESKGEWIAFIDDDEIAEPDWLKTLMNEAAISNADCVGGIVKLKLPGGLESNILGTVRKHFGEASPDMGWFQKRLNYYGPGTGNALVKANVFEHIGFFDPSLPQVGEDQDFFRRARRSGYKIVHSWNALVHHAIPVSRLEPGTLLSQSVQGGRGLAYFDGKYRGHWNTLLICVLRIGHACFLTIPRFLWAHLNHDKHDAFSRKCSLYTASGYVLGTFSDLLHKF